MNPVSTPTGEPSGEFPPQVPGLELVRQIGRGGFGEVWIAKNETIGALLAVKIIPLQLDCPRDAAGREIKSLTCLKEIGRIQHPNLLEIKHISTSSMPSLLFYTMDLADDDSGAPPSLDPRYRPATLATRLENGPCGADKCLEYARQLLAGLAFLHQRGMVHRDVKPTNCVFVEGGLKLADFGLLTKADTAISRVGTLRYMPPDGEMDARADVYAAGLIIYEMITGLTAASFPRLGDRADEIIENPILRALNRLALKACQQNRPGRFQNAQQMLSALDRLIQPRRFSRRLAVITGSAMLLVVVPAVGHWVAQPTRIHVNSITRPHGALIYLDGKEATAPDGSSYLTPCSIPDLPARTHHVAFKFPGLSEIDAGRIDFSKVREVIVDLRRRED